jgi:hypothetical protein
MPCVRCNEWRTNNVVAIRSPLEDAGRANVPPARVIAGPRALLTFRPFHLVATALPAGDRAVAPFDGGRCRGPYSAEAARNPAMSVMKAAANQSSSGEWEDHGSSTGYRVPQF